MWENNTNFKKYKELYDRFNTFNRTKIPLCAAENYVSEFVKSALNSTWNGKYSLSNNDFSSSSDFIGGNYVHELVAITVNQCNKIFSAKYSNPKTLTGMNCFTVTLMSCMDLCDNRKAFITTPDCGGHASIPAILSSVGFEFDSIPYNFNKYDIDYTRANSLLKKNKYGLVVIALSDLLQQPNIDKMDIPKDTIIIYDATQTLGLIAAKLCDNPLLSKHNNLLLIGGTHKTLPGPSCGLIMTNNDNLYRSIEHNISPVFLRDFQPNNVAGLLMALIEAEEIGEEYQNNIIWTANCLGDKLDRYGFHVASLSEQYTKTHQIFLKTSMDEMEMIYSNAIKYGITLNKKMKPLFNGYGIRIGVQEIARYSWKEKELELLANIIFLLKQEHIDNDYIKKLINTLCDRKNPNYIIL